MVDAIGSEVPKGKLSIGQPVLVVWREGMGGIVTSGFSEYSVIFFWNKNILIISNNIFWNKKYLVQTN